MDAANVGTKLYNSGDQCLDLIIKRIYENFSGDEIDNNIGEVRKIFNKFSEVQEEWILANNCIEKIRENGVDNFSDGSDDVFKVYETLLKKDKEDLAKKNGKKKVNNEFDMKLAKLSIVEDNDVIETQSSINLIDPISKKQMTNPVKNIHCNHTYEMETITSYINDKKHKKPRCPYQGCCNTQPLTLSDLIPDQLALQQLQKTSSSH